MMVLVLASGVVMFLATIVISRVGGARTLASVSAFDFIANVAVGAMVGSVIVSPTIGVVNGLVVVATLFLLRLVLSLLRSRTRLCRAITTGPGC